MPKILIDLDRCKGCGLCVAFCPKGALAMSSRLSRRGVNPPEMVDEDACTGCANCAVICPDACIEIIETTAAKT